LAKQYVAVNEQGHQVVYTDRKKFWWLLSWVYPVLPLLGIALHAYTGYTAALALPILLSHLGMPLLDAVFGEDVNNPPEEVVPALDQDRYYRWLTWITVPLHFLTLFVCAWWVGTQELSWGVILMLAYVAGMHSGLGLNTGHELGHKYTSTEQWLARLVLAVPVYGHFTVEHGQGHHRWVATPEDHASARMGESIYRFALRELPGGVRRAWQIESARLTKAGHAVWGLHNTMLQSYAIAATLQIGLLFAFGWVMVPFLIVHNIIAWWQLTSANYVASNLALFHLQRHSDHHAFPSRRYQSLRNFENLPQLPSGYFGMFPLAYLPPLWFKVMNPRLLALPHIQGDMLKINIDPSQRAAILQQYATGSRS
jgi:alkane 1-monooxygenase